ncbi:AAA family ATPase [Salinigranum halophilum]|uniref:AAA family ATPase n=1 Tax=Salinigranum halophilum TaxID=2565931 RepID=UPI0010A76068|nr:AAA family ATPase [Salinigranum halophilum]
MREETVNRRITSAIEQIPVAPLQRYLKDRIRFERSKMDKDQPYFKNSYREATQEFASVDSVEYRDINAREVTATTQSTNWGEQATGFDSEPVQIFEIGLQNWRQYGGKQRVELNAVDGKLINIVEGQNGAGKSNLLNAITLCFYGKEVQKQSDGDKLDRLPYVTRAKLEEADIGETLSGHIEIVLGLSEPEYLLRREFRTKKKRADEFDDTLDELELRRKVEGEWRRTDNASNYLNQVLPARVSDYFLFDGEDLDGFFDSGYTERVEEAILDVSHLELINRAVDHFNKIQSDIEREASDVEGEAAEVREEIDAAEARVNEIEVELERVNNDISETQENIEGIDTKLKDVSDDYVRNKYQQQESLNEDILEAEERREELETDVKELLTEVGPIIQGAESLLNAYDNLEDMSETESIPPRIQRRFIDELIRRGTCICGRSLDEDSPEEDHLEELRESVFNVSESQLEDASRIPTMFETTDEKVDLLVEKRQEMVHLEDEIDQKKSEIQNIKAELKAYEIPSGVDVSTLESNREELQNELEELREIRARRKIDLDDAKEALEELREELNEEIQKQEEHKELQAQLALVKLAKECLIQIKESILRDIRLQTRENIENYFNQLIWKREDYEIVLGDDYSIAVLDEFGDNKIGSLSAGETQVLALSFMAALTQISGFNAPVVIDTPLGRISSTPKRLIAQNLPDYMSDTQITFLMTDEEYTAEVREIMQTAVGREYRLVYDNNVTDIVPREQAQEVDV